MGAVYWAEGMATGAAKKGGADGNGRTMFGWINGSLLILSCFVGALGLPVFATHTWALLRYIRSGKPGAGISPF